MGEVLVVVVDKHDDVIFTKREQAQFLRDEIIWPIVPARALNFEVRRARRDLVRCKALRRYNCPVQIYKEIQ